MKSELTIIPLVSVNPRHITVYNEIHWSHGKPSRDRMPDLFIDIDNLPDNFRGSKRTADGKVSLQAKRKIGKALDYLLTMANPKKVTSRTTGRHFKFKIGFITLTLPSEQIHTDNEIKSKCLNSLLIELKKYYHVKNYVWRAEKQKNGNLHFHIIVDKFIPWSELRDRWNRIVNKLGYVDRYREELKNWHQGGFKVREDLLKKWDYKKQIKAYQAGKANDWNSPNSTDIHSVQKILNIKAYVSKYLTKQPDEIDTKDDGREKYKTQKGRIWGCNYELSDLKGAQSQIDSLIGDELKKIEASGKARIFRDRYFSVIYIDFEDLTSIGAENLYQSFCGYLIDRFGYSHQPFIH